MSNTLVLILLHLLVEEEGHGLYLFFGYLETKYDLKVSVENIFRHRVQSDLKLLNI